MPATIELDLRDLTKALKRMEREGLDLRPAWKALRGPLRKDQRDHMRKGEGPDGSSWAPLARATREKRRKAIMGDSRSFTKRGKIRKPVQRRLDRVLSNKLTSGAKVRTSRRIMAITSKVPWAGVHQEGGTVGRGARLPARPFMWISDELALQVREVIKRRLRDAFEGRKL